MHCSLVIIVAILCYGWLWLWMDGQNVTFWFKFLNGNAEQAAERKKRLAQNIIGRKKVWMVAPWHQPCHREWNRLCGDHGRFVKTHKVSPLEKQVTPKHGCVLLKSYQKNDSLIAYFPLFCLWSRHWCLTFFANQNGQCIKNVPYFCNSNLQIMEKVNHIHICF